VKPGALLLVGAGGFLGAIARYVVGMAVARRLGTSWPYGTFIINLSGCFAIGFFLTLASERIVVHEAWRYLFPIGFVGAYTTFSTYEYETARLVEDGAWGRALTYVGLSTVAGFAAVVLATWAARRF
jgi:fluoride exporter